MAFMTARKQAGGMGSAKTGTEHHWHMTVTSVALVILIPFFVFTFGSVLGGTYEDITAYYSRPFPALIAALTILVGFIHFRQGAQSLIEDYTHGLTRKALIVALICVSYGAAAAGVFAVARLAL
jgi:succinate dehydrogenase / fumarate reductase membrane anchor subunit